jgi:hypothetical protein
MNFNLVAPGISGTFYGTVVFANNSLLLVTVANGGNFAFVQPLSACPFDISQPGVPINIAASAPPGSQTVPTPSFLTATWYNPGEAVTVPQFTAPNQVSVTVAIPSTASSDTGAVPMSGTPNSAAFGPPAGTLVYALSINAGWAALTGSGVIAVTDGLVNLWATGIFTASGNLNVEKNLGPGGYVIQSGLSAECLAPLDANGDLRAEAMW